MVRTPPPDQHGDLFFEMIWVPKSGRRGKAAMGRYEKLSIATPMHSTQLGIDGQWRLAQSPMKSAARRAESAYRTFHSPVVHVELGFDVYASLLRRDVEPG